MCMELLEKLSKAEASGISLVSVIATQSPWLARIASGSERRGSLATACLSLASTKSFPSGSDRVGVRWIVLPIVTTLNVRTRRPCGQSASLRLFHGLVPADVWPVVAPSHGVPLWPAGVKGGRLPMFVRNIGYAGR